MSFNFLSYKMGNLIGLLQKLNEKIDMDVLYKL